MLKTVVLPNVLSQHGTLLLLFFFSRILWWIESSKEQYFDQFNAYLLNKIKFFKNSLLTPNFWTVVYIFTQSSKYNKFAAVICGHSNNNPILNVKCLFFALQQV